MKGKKGREKETTVTISWMEGKHSKEKEYLANTLTSIPLVLSTYLPVGDIPATLITVDELHTSSA